jgi:hypothetical protein
MNNKLSLSDIIFLSKNSDNIVMTNWLEELEQMIKENPNNFILGEKVRRL